jgi:hypothetical protein
LVLAFAGVHHQLAPLAVQADGLVADLAHQEHRPPGGLFHGQTFLVLAPRRLQRLAHRALGPKKAVGGRGVVQGLMGAEMVVVVDVVGQSPLGILQVLRLGPGPELLAHGLPEALAFAHRLRVVGP